MSRRVLTPIVLALTLAVTGCGVFGDDRRAEPQSSSPTPTPTVEQKGHQIPEGGVFDRADALASLSYSTDTGKTANLDVLALQRVAPKTVVARFRLRGGNSNAFTYGDNDHGTYQSWAFSFNSMRLVDLTGRRLYMPAARENGECACTSWESYAGIDGDHRGATLWAAFQVPKRVTAVAVGSWHPDMGITDELPIAAADAPLPKLPDEPKGSELAGAGWDSYPLSAASLGDDKRVKEEGRSVTVELASDVLFEFGKANLTDKAHGQLRKIAHRLNAQAGDHATITGYTDSIGSKRDNLKLSKRRARAVADALRSMLDDGLELQVEGKGEADPVAPNRKNGKDNPKGRRLNRRVEISYERHVEAPEQTATPEPEPTNTGTVGTVRGTAEHTRGVELRVHGVRRLAGGTAIVSYTAANTGSQAVDLDQFTHMAGDFGWLSTWVAHYQGTEAYWVRLENGDTAHLPLADSTGHCICSKTTVLDPGGSVDMWAVTTAPPDGVTQTDVTFVNYGTVTDVPVTG